MKEIASEKLTQELPAICIICGTTNNLNFVDYTFAYKTPLALLGGIFAGFINFGFLSVNLSYNLEHKSSLNFCNKCLRKNKNSERDGLIAAILFFVLGALLLFAGIILDDWFHNSSSAYKVITLPFVGWIFRILLENALPVFFISMFVFFVIGLIIRWIINYLSKPKAIILRNQIILKIPKGEAVIVKFKKPELKLDIG